MTTPHTTIDPEKLEATVEQIFGYLGGAVIASMIYLGDHLGLYRTLADAGDAMTSDELARFRTRDFENPMNAYYEVHP